ncbi:MAG: hypothetical protein JWP11_1318 [Frankiales bacterium]|nr:hypothetical protein [Frankiales bacterium]
MSGDALAQVLRELEAERYTRPLKDYRREWVMQEALDYSAPAWTAEEQAMHRAVALRESLAYAQAHPEGFAKIRAVS